MEIGNQQGRMLYVDYEALMLDSISVASQIRKDFTVENNLKFVLNINQNYDYFKKEFDLNKDQVKRAKKKIFDQYEKIIPNSFKVVIGFNKYLVNEYGVVINRRTRCILRSSLNHKGYPQVCLTNKHSKAVHRIVAEAWIPNPDNKPEVNHMDGNKLKNFVSNLEWNTQAENAEHKKIHNLGKTKKAKDSATGVKNSQAKLKDSDIYYIRNNFNNNALELGCKFEVSTATIYDIVNRRSWTHI